MNAITTVDKDAVSKIVESDAKINKFRSSIDQQIMTHISKKISVAIDLRYAISTLKISQDLERIGDLAKGNAKKILPLPDDLPPEMLKRIESLGEIVQKQLKFHFRLFYRKICSKEFRYN